ncbi:hypothetical protein [Sessilibacter sp. MAH4]
MEYLYQEKINTVIPDTQFRQRDPLFKNSEAVQKHKAHRQKPRKDQETEERAKKDPDAPIINSKFAKRARKLNQK